VGAGITMAVTREEVIFAYRLLLDRMPESEEVIQNHTRADSLRSLLHGFMRSPEFLEKATSLAVTRLPLNVPAIELDTDASDHEVAQCLARIKEAWTHLGAVTPHFSVLTESQFLPENIEGSLEGFWASGQAEAARLADICQRFELRDLPSKTCVELGCGVGRVTTGLAKLCATVRAYDISANHLAYAVQRARALALTNIAFHLCSDNLLETLGPCDLFYSAIVLQHNPPVVISRLVRNALRSLRVGGLAIFQVPTYELGYRFKTSEWLAAKHALDMQMHCLPQARIFEIASEEHCRVLEVREDAWAGPPNKRLSNTFVIRKMA